MAATKLIINNNGSVKVEGDFEIVDKDGNAYGLQGRTILSLCRCGRSANKPFCDGSHKEHFEQRIAEKFDYAGLLNYPKKSRINFCRRYRFVQNAYDDSLFKPGKMGHQ